MSNVSGIVKSIRDIMRKDKGTYGDVQRLEQLGWMFFLKIFDDREQEMELLKDNYQSPIAKDLRWSNWATDEEGITGDNLLNFVDNDLLPSLKELKNTGNPIISLIKNAFEDATNYMKNGTLLRQVINKVNKIDFNSSEDRHTFGDIYEKLLSELQAAKDAGEFYTPRAVTEFIVERVNPELHEKILDPACGTGGFLVNVIEHLRKKAITENDQKLLQEAFTGIEKKHLPYILCMTNLLLHGIDIPKNVKSNNTLARPLKDWNSNEKVDAIVTNPPFGGIEEDGIEKNFPGEFQTKETADLFLVLMMRLLKNGGRAGLVLPDSILFGEGVKTRIKEALLKECNLHTIVRLPKSVFAPYTSISTNLLFFTKGKPTKEIWYYEHQLPYGVKSYNKTKPINIREFQPIKDWWGTEKDDFQTREENEYAWKVSYDEIVSRNINLDISNPYKNEQDNQNPNELLFQYKEQQDMIQKLRTQLKTILEKANFFQAWKPIKNNFDTVFTTEYSIDQLKQTILQLAVTGKLVPQDVDDEPASILLKKIQLEKANLIKYKKIRKTTLPKFLSYKEYLFSLPIGWEWAPIGIIGNIFNGNSISTDVKERKYTNIAGRPYLSTKDIAYGFESLKYNTGVAIPLNESNFKITSKNSVLICSEGGSAGKKCGITDREICFGNKLYANELHGNINPRFILAFYLTPLFYKQFSQKMTGIIGGVSVSKFSQIQCPVPPIAEQSRIVAKIDELLDICEKIKENISKKQNTQNRLAESFMKLEFR